MLSGRRNRPRRRSQSVGLADWSMPQESVAAANSSHLERFLVTTRLSAFRQHPDSDNSNIEPPLRRCLEDYHIELIALGGAIGTGLLVGTGDALAAGGPISLLASFAWVGVTVYFTVQALGEMTILFPLPGSFTTFSGRFIDQAWGAAMGWNYAVQWLIFLPLELVASSITLQYWGSPMPHAAWVTIFLVLITIINVFGVKGYGHVEASLGMMKVVTVVIFIILGVFIDMGIGWEGNAIGAKFWYNPGAFNNGVIGFCSAMAIAAFAYSGTELVGLAAAESRNPRGDFPKAVNKVFWRILIFYIGSIVIVGLLVPFTHPRLMGHDQSPPPPPSQGQPPPSQGQPPPIACASPFVIATQNAGLGVLPSIINGVILATVLSVANSSVYGSTRTLNAMALQGQAPKIFKYIDTKGRPMTCHALALGFGLLAYLAQLSYPWVAFMWFLALSGLSSVITWTSICYAHIRFRTAWRAQGNSPDNLPFRSPFGVVGSWIGLFLNASIILMQLVAAIFPIGHQSMPLCMRIRTFFSLFTTFPLVVLFYFVYKWWNGTVVRNPRLEHHGDCLICPPHLESGGASTTSISAISSSCPFVDLSQKDELPNGYIEEPEKWWWKTCPDSIRRLLVRLKFPWY